MKRLSICLALFVVLLMNAVPAYADLINRGGGLIYDTVLDITWLQDANYAMTSGTALPCAAGARECNSAAGAMPWDQAMAWADQLVYGGFSGWRLPDAHNQDGTGPDITPSPGSEMGHMFYNSLRGVRGAFPGAEFVDGNGSIVSFVNLGSSGDTWWLGDEWGEDTSSAWYFVIGYNESSGNQHGMEKWRARYAWAVHDGDIGAASVPEPGSLLLFGTGLVGLVTTARRRLRK